ncbi:LysR family transcriptional regulator [Gymnodinialimonas sp. 2305UL16-5]|uniref:LysR family transcriptional regulator n=1 Tax=Gymnodinialimonas mytili TaxID=3126503 RepID=UPI0030964891
MNTKLNWTDYETVLQIAETGTLSAAARLAGSSHPTMFRRVNAIEQKLGVRLFERFRTGYQATPAGEEIVATARQFAQLANETERRVSGRDLRPSGLVRIATTDTLLYGLLAPRLAELREQEPQISVEVVVSNEVADLSLRHADIAIRPMLAPDGYLIGRRLGTIQQCVYIHRAHHTATAKTRDLADLPWVGPSASMTYPQFHAWLREHQLDDRCGYRVDSLLGMYSAVRAKIGASILPIYLAKQDPDLARIADAIPDMAVDLWLLTHPDLTRVGRVRAVLDHLAKSGIAQAL